MAKISLALSGLFLVSACLVNPLALKLYRENPVNYEDVGFIALLWNLGFTSVFLALRFFLSRSSSLAPNWILLLATCALIIWSDRMLLAWSGRPHWVTDPVLHYRHRPDTQRTWGWNNQFAIKEIEQKSLRLNRHGHHDDDFAVAKPQGQFRGLFLGDSIVMGHGVTAGETFANRLESTLERFGRGYDSYQIINAGVQGYSTSQELALLREEIRFAPDFIAIGFCLNDVTVPFVLPDGQSVTAPNMDLVRVAGSATGPWFLRFLLNETGYGQCIQKLRQWLYAQQSGPDPWHEDLKEVARSRREDPRVSAGWDLVLKDLESVYRLAAQAEIPVTLIIFPTVSQLFTPQAKEPQRILGRHAQAHGVTAIDMATELESWLERRMETAISAVYSSAILPAVLREVVNLLAFEYFIDGMHLTPKGHRVTAAALLRHLDAKGLVDIADEAQVILRSELDPYLKEDGYLGNFSLALDNVASIAHTGKAFALMGNIAGAEMFYSLGLQTFKNLDSQKFLYRQLVELYSAAGRHTDARQIQKKLAALAPDMP